MAGEWSFLPQLPSPRRDHGAGWVGGRLVVVGGWNMDPYYDTCEVFCPRSQAQYRTLRVWEVTAPSQVFT